MKYLYLSLLCFICTPAFAQVVFNNYDISTGADSSTPVQFVNCNNNMYFFANTPAYGTELWMIDKNGNTQMLADINPGASSSDPLIIGEVNGKLIFIATDTAHGTELWITDGTTSGTKLLIDIYPGNKSGARSSMKNIFDNKIQNSVNGKLYFVGQTAANGSELWATDGTNTGTYLVADIQPGPGSSFPSDINTVNGKVFFWANDGIHEYEPWISDGTQAGTSLLKDINPTSGSNFVRFSTTANGLCYFWARADHTQTGIGPWVTDGTTAGTIPLKNSKNGSGSFISNFVAYKNKVYYYNHCDTGIAAQLWETDGTYNGTHVFSNAAPNTYHHCSRNFLVFKDKLYFTGGLYKKDTFSSCELWVTDGTDAGTGLVKDLNGNDNSTPVCLTQLGNYLYFIAEDSGYVKLYRTDGTTSGTQMLAPYNATNKNAFDWGYILSLHTYNNKIWTSAAFTNTGVELWSVEDVFPQHIQANTNNTADVRIYPNPAHNSVTIKVTTAYTTGSVTLTDATGRVVKSQKLSSNLETISIYGIAPGMYMADVWLDDRRNTQTLIIQ